MEDKLIELKTQETFEDALTEVLRNGVRRLLTDAVEVEVELFYAVETGNKMGNLYIGP